MAKKPESLQPILELDSENTVLIKTVRYQKQKIDELEKRLSHVEQKLEDLSEQFAEEYGEELADNKEEEE